jgi:hypothetical protein
MRSVRMTLGLAAALCALGATSASALAHEFVSSVAGKTISEAEPAKTKTTSLGSQTFTFGAIKITCLTANGKGLVIAASQSTLKTTMKYHYCSTAIKVGPEPASLPTRFSSAVEYNFHANGFAETGTEGEEESAVEIGSGTAEMKVSGIKCVVSWPAQFVPVKAETKPEKEYTAAVYSNTEVATEKLKAFPTGFQKKIDIAMNFKGMEFSLEGSTCEGFKNTGSKSGYSSGIVLEEVINGNLSWK